MDGTSVQGSALLWIGLGHGKAALILNYLSQIDNLSSPIDNPVQLGLQTHPIANSP
jgi:hypothetical protein